MWFIDAPVLCVTIIQSSRRALLIPNTHFVELGVKVIAMWALRDQVAQLRLHIEIVRVGAQGHTDACLFVRTKVIIGWAHRGT